MVEIEAFFSLAKQWKMFFFTYDQLLGGDTVRRLVNGDIMEWNAASAICRMMSEQFTAAIIISWQQVVASSFSLSCRK